MTGKNYLLYARVSPKGSTWSAEETSIGVQLAEMRAHCRRLDPEAKFIEVFDEFKSGKDLRRAGVQRILADLDRRPVPWQCLVVWNLDRLSRSLCDALPILTKLRDAGCEFVSVNQEYLSYTGAMARYMMQQTISLAELERGMTSERVSAKMRWIAAAGKVPWGRLPLGLVRDPEKKNTVIVDAEGAEIVRGVFRLYAAGKLGFEEVERRWPGVFSGRPALYAVLRNPLYAGEIHYAGKVYPAEHPAIVDRELWEEVQRRLAEGKRQSYARHGVQQHDYLLSGLVRCHCGHQMTGYSVPGRNGGRFFYYKCTAPLCKNAINADALENGVLQQIAGIYTGEAEIKKSLETYLEEERRKSAKACARVAELDRDLAAAEAEEKRIREMFLSGVVNPGNADYWNDALLQARERRARLQDARKAAAGIPTPDMEKLYPQLLRAAREWSERILSSSATPTQKRDLILSTVEGLDCLARADGRIHFRLRLIMTSSIEWWARPDFVIIRILTFDVGRRGPMKAKMRAAKAKKIEGRSPRFRQSLPAATSSAVGGW